MTLYGLGSLSDREVILALQEVTEDLTADASPETTPLDQDEAALLLVTLLNLIGEDATVVTTSADAAAYAAARRLLEAFASEHAFAPLVAGLAEDPPEDSRLNGDLAVPGVVVLAAAVTWLQTKVDIHFKRVGGKTEFEFRLGKEPAEGSTLRDIAAALSRLLGGPRR